MSSPATARQPDLFNEPAIERRPEREPWKFVAPAPGTELRRQLVAIGVQMLAVAGDYGVIVGEVVQEAERRGIKVGGEKMKDPIREQRQTSWLAHVMPEAGGVPRGDTRPSPLKRHHGKTQRIYVRGEVNP